MVEVLSFEIVEMESHAEVSEEKIDYDWDSSLIAAAEQCCEEYSIWRAS